MERYCYAPWIVRKALRVLDRESRRECLEAAFEKADERALHRVVSERDLRSLLLRLDGCYGGGETVPGLLTRPGVLSPSRIANILQAIIFVDEGPGGGTWVDFMANPNGRRIALDLVRRLLEGLSRLEGRLEKAGNAVSDSPN